MKTGAVELISGVYYLEEDGTAQNGFFTDDEGETRYCTSKGKMLTGWQTIDNEQYYFDADGVMAKGITAVGSKEYVFDPDDGQLVRDMVSIDGEMVYANSDGTLKHGPGLNGIDVSSWNGNINWTAVKNAGISFAIIRAGGRGTTQGSLYEDKYFKANIAGATAAGIKVGVYFYSQAITEAEAKQEAEMVLSLVSGYQVSYPIFIDVEASGGRADSLSRAARTNVINAFCSTIQARGYKAGVYANKNWMTNYINVSALRSNVTIWLAQYNSTITYQGNVDIWQYSSKGTVSGISGNVDMDLCYTRFR
jgi:glucan-binding repeat-containing protein